MRRSITALALAAALTALAAAPDARAATSSRLYIVGAGFGHGVGMSQYGALGFARHGKTYREILAHYYRGTAIGSTPSREVRVLLQSRPSASFTGAISAGGRRLNPARTYRITRRNSTQVVLRSASNRAIKTFTAPLRVTGAGPLRLRGGAGNGVTSGRYRGALEFRPGVFSGVNAINAVSLEHYVQGVVPAESPSSWPAEALKAQAVAARTYAITTSKRGAGFEHYPDVRSQVYKGLDGEVATTNAATRATRGEIVTFEGRPVVTYFFSTSGGRTEDVEHGFVGADPAPWLKSVADPYDDVSPKHRWGPYRLTLSRAGSKLRGLVRGSFRSIDVIRRGSSPRIVRAEIVGTGGRTSVTGAQLRARFGLFDSWAYFTVVSSGDRPPTSVPPPEAEAPPRDPGEPSGGTSPGQAAGGPVGRIAGRITPLRAGRWITVERRTGRRWTRVAEARLRSTGTYSASVNRRGTYRIRYGRIAGPSVRIG